VPRQNRVNPFGEILAVPERGTLMGNRGVLHDAAGRVRRAWQLKRWLVCVLEFRGRKRAVMTPGHYTELFFLDEATALAAGHRPCAECRRNRFLAYCDAWAAANPRAGGPSRPTAAVIDERLHAERVAPDRTQRTFEAELGGLPNGVLVTLAGKKGQPYLVWDDGLLAWSAGGYGERRPRPEAETVRVLTPASSVGVLRAGYAPQLHPSAA
jgi:hypothetical protein